MSEFNSISWRIKFALAWFLHLLRYAHEDDGAAQYCYFCGNHLSRRWPLDRFVT